MKRLTKRGWNNVLIFSIIAFMLILNFPTIVKNHFMEPPQNEFPYVLVPLEDITEMNFSRLSLKRENGNWVSSQPLSVSALELVQRWKLLAGTEVDEQTFSQLKENLPKANTLEVWYLEREEPQRITYYQTPKFWLMKSWEDKWIAVSVEESYLFPLE